MKIYFVCSGDSDWWSCHGVLSNGFHFGSHICSHPNYAPSDLYSRRENRKEALKKIFNIDEETVERELLIVQKREDLPKELLDNDTEEVQKSLEPFYIEYEAMCGGKQ